MYDALTCRYDASQRVYKFTGKERDSESGLDNFGARYMGSSLGRFMSPDWSANPSPVPFAELADPQSLNLYSYTRNNPMNRTDPSGHCTIDGERHNWLWCAAHSLGITETKNEYNQRIEQERQWLITNIAQNGKRASEFRSASAKEIDGQFGYWRTYFNATGAAGLIYFRGGASIEPKPGEYRVDEEGNVKPTHGVARADVPGPIPSIAEGSSFGRPKGALENLESRKCAVFQSESYA